MTVRIGSLPTGFPVQVKYVTVASQFIKGVKWGDDGTWQQRIAGAGYKQVMSAKLGISPTGRPAVG